jgi:ligand-binding sensor domain-containing protein
VWFSACSGFLQAQPALYRHYEISSLPAAVSLNCAAIDQYGMMWVGTEQGLFNFDGAFFHSQSPRDSNSFSVTALAPVGDSLYLSTAAGDLMHRSVRIWEKESSFDTSFSAPVTGIIASADGDLAVSTYGNGLFKRYRGTWFHYSAPELLPSAEIYCMKRNAQGDIWIGTDEGLTQCRFDGSKLSATTFARKDGLSDQIIKSIFVDQQGKIWVGTYSAGVAIFNPSSQRFEPVPFSEGWEFGPVTAICIQGDRRLMIGTQRRGVLCLSMDNLHHLSVFDKSTGYDNFNVTSIMLDEEGNFWVTSKYNGFDMFPGLFQWIPGIGRGVLALTYDSESHRIWYASLSGLYYLSLDSAHRSGERQIRLLAGSSTPAITSIYQDGDDNLWVGTLDEGVFLLPKGKTSAIQLKEQHGLVNNNVLSITGSDASVWFATLGGASRTSFKGVDFTRSRPQFENYTEARGLRSSYIYQILVDSKNKTWFATDGEGLKCLIEGRFITVDQVDSIRIKTVYSITEDREGHIWFSTPASGIFRHDGNTYLRVSEAEGISDLSITAIVADQNNDVLLIEKDGLEVYESNTGQIRRYHDRTFFEDIEPGINGHFEDAFGNIWIPTSKGILKYFPPDPSYSDQARLELIRVQLYLEPFDFTHESRFAYGKNHLTFDFQGFWNYNPSQIRYRYKLDGYDLDWIMTRDERVIYPNLPPGTYTFMVQATIHHNFDDVITRTYSFTINPPFWKTWWFIIISTMVGTYLVYLLVRVRERQIERVAAMKRQAVEFQLENLKTQINPHFLFNSFNTLSTLIEEDQRLAVTYVENLSDFYRHSLKFKDTDLITLGEEKELADNYVFLLKQRHGDSLRVNFHLRHEDLQNLIPPLTLQLLIENAVKHNIVSRDRPLTIIIESHGLELTIKNNLQRRATPAASTRTGLRNINTRFEILGGNPVSISETETHFIVTVHLIQIHSS